MPFLLDGLISRSMARMAKRRPASTPPPFGTMALTTFLISMPSTKFNIARTFP